MVGGGNSAGQAAVFLAGTVARTCTCWCAAPAWRRRMSDYLVQRIERATRITLHAHAEIAALEGEHVLCAASPGGPAQRRARRPRPSRTSSR